MDFQNQIKNKIIAISQNRDYMSFRNIQSVLLFQIAVLKVTCGTFRADINFSLLIKFSCDL